MLANDADRNALAAQRESVGCRFQTQGYSHLALTAHSGQLPFKLLVIIAIESHPGTKRPRHLLRVEPVALGAVDTKSLQLTVGINIAQSVAIGKRSRSCHIERVATQLLDGSHKLAHRLGSVR